MIWKLIPGFDRFEVSDTGLVRCKVPGYNSPVGLRKTFVQKGYARITLPIGGGKKRHVLVHRAVALAFLGPPPTPEHEVAHGDGNRMNNNLENLRWATGKENAADRTPHGTLLYGERTPAAILTDAQAAAILASDRPGVALAADFGVSQATVSMIRNGHTWKHLERQGPPDSCRAG